MPEAVPRPITERRHGRRSKRLIQLPALCFPLPGTRYPVPVTRYPLPGTRYPVPGTRYPLPAKCGVRCPVAIERLRGWTAPEEGFGVADFRKLRVWRAAQELAIDAHRVTARMREVRSATLHDQFTRAAMSVPTNIVEGSAHESPREFARFLRYVLASV
jgi:23S rRNA-intervening sequence protein